MVAQDSLAAPDIMSLFRDLQARGPAPAEPAAPVVAQPSETAEPAAASSSGHAELDLLSLQPQLPAMELGPSSAPVHASADDSVAGVQLTGTGRGPEWTAGTLIERIMELNPSASVHFLSRFNETSLREYLEHLLLQRELAPRTGEATLPTDPVVMVTRRWVRPSGRPGILSREADA
ncbi:MAG: hypothetical protein SFY95_11900 [Planctomycetota bacterium]|nr:hypothetical protein [Planctomycetota bacterium]